MDKKKIVGVALTAGTLAIQGITLPVLADEATPSTTAEAKAVAGAKKRALRDAQNELQTAQQVYADKIVDYNKAVNKVDEAYQKAYTELLKIRDLEIAKDAKKIESNGIRLTQKDADEMQDLYDQALSEYNDNNVKTLLDNLTNAKTTAEELNSSYETAKQTTQDAIATLNTATTALQQATQKKEQANSAYQKANALYQDLLKQQEGMEALLEQLNTAKSELQTATTNYTNAESTCQEATNAYNLAVQRKATAEDALLKAKSAYTTANQTYELAKSQYKQAQKDYEETTYGTYTAEDVTKAEKRVTDAKNQIKLGSTGYFKEIADGNSKFKDDAKYAYRILTEKNIGLQDGIDPDTNKQPTENFSKYTSIGAENDATSLEHMKKAVDDLDEVNKYRQQENEDEGTKLTDLKVSHTLMAIAQYQLNASKDKPNLRHTHAFNVGENLVWGYKNPFIGWYTEEKDLAKKGETDEEKLGHYYNIINKGIRNYTAMGYAFTEGIGVFGGNNGGAYSQTFGLKGTHYGDNYLMTVKEYQDSFDAYYNKVTKELSDANTALEIIRANLGENEATYRDRVNNAKNAMDEAERKKNSAYAVQQSAEQELINAKNDLTAKTTTKTDAEQALASARSTKEEKQKAVNDLKDSVDETYLTRLEEAHEDANQKKAILDQASVAVTNADIDKQTAESNKTKAEGDESSLKTQKDNADQNLADATSAYNNVKQYKEALDKAKVDLDQAISDKTKLEKLANEIEEIDGKLKDQPTYTEGYDALQRRVLGITPYINFYAELYAGLDDYKAEYQKANDVVKEKQVAYNKAKLEYESAMTLYNLYNKLLVEQEEKSKHNKSNEQLASSKTTGVATASTATATGLALTGIVTANLKRKKRKH